MDKYCKQDIIGHPPLKAQRLWKEEENLINRKGNNIIKLTFVSLLS